MRRLILLGGFWLSGQAAHAQDRFIEDVRVSRAGATAEVVIELACPMRFVSDVATQQGVLIEVRVAPFEACRQLGLSSGINSEITRPVGGNLAELVQIEYESLGLGDSLLMLRFSKPVRYRVTQQGNLRSLLLTIEPEESPVRVEPPTTRAGPLPAPAPEARQGVPAPDRDPLTVRVRRPEVLGDYMINLDSTLQRLDPELANSVETPAGRTLYVSETTVDGRTWHRLRLGFFESEAAARETLATLQEVFPRAWVGRAELDEIQAASSSELGSSGPGLPTVSADALAAEAAATPAATSEAVATLAGDDIASLLEDARSAMLDSRFDDAIRIYTRLLQEPGEHQAQAREFLGLARERNGQLAHARAEYQAYLEEYPDSEGVQRVQQRLTGLVMAAETPRERLRETAPAGRSKWDFATGISQYYRHDVNQFDEDQAEIVTMSALLSDIDFSVGRSGTRLDMLGRVSLTHIHDLLEDGVSGGDDQSRVSYAYFDVASARRDWSVRAGRQSLHHWGVLGRFDGAHLTYGWAPDRRVHVTAGYPVESTRSSLDSSREFYGVAVDFDDLVGDWDLSTFINTQSIDGIDARRAVGTELSYVDERRSFTTLVDYDVDFGELNTMLMLGTLRLKQRVTLSALIDSRTSPILTTRNALIGQPVESIDELALVWSEDEIRQLAVDRTSRVQTVTLGLALPLAERYQLNADITQTEIDATVASGGVPAVPGTGPQLFVTTSIVGTGLFGSGDVTILTLRHGEADNFTQDLLTWDARFAIGRHLRINPRLRLGIWEDVLEGRRRETVSPSLRFLLNARNRYRLEFEVGSDRSTRTDSGLEQQAVGTYLTLGYQASF